MWKKKPKNFSSLLQPCNLNIGLGRFSYFKYRFHMCNIYFEALSSFMYKNNLVVNMIELPKLFILICFSISAQGFVVTGEVKTT